MKWPTVHRNRNFSKRGFAMRLNTVEAILGGIVGTIIMTLISSILEKAIDPTHVKAIVRTLDL